MKQGQQGIEIALNDSLCTVQCKYRIITLDITWMDEVTVQILHKRGQRLLGSVLETRVEAGPGLGEAGALKHAE